MSDRPEPRGVEIPRWFLDEIAPQIREISELQVMLAYFRIATDRGLTEPIQEDELLQDALLNQSLRFDAASRVPYDRIHRGIELAVARDSILRFTVDDDDGETSYWLMLATPDNRVKLDRYRSGLLQPPEVDGSLPRPARVASVRPGVFKLYEQNVGLVTPIIADRLIEALELYPERWIEDAIAAAVSYNRRNWRYIQRILETWATEGRSNEADRRHQTGSGDFDPARNLRGEYAAVFRRRKRD